MRRRPIALAKLAVTLTLLALLYARVDTHALGQRLGGVRWEWLVFFWAVLLSNSALSALKWRVLLAADGIRVDFGTLLASYLIGSFFNVFLPSTIGGDAYRIADVGRRSARTAHTAASVMADRLTGLLALVFYGLALFPAFRWMYAPDGRLVLLPAAALAGLFALGFILWDQALLRRLAARLPSGLAAQAGGLLDALHASLSAYGQRKGVLRACLAISFLFQWLAIVAVHGLGRALGLDLPLLAFGFFVPFVSLMEMLPVSIFGIGLRDTGYVWFMQSVGRSREDAAALSVLYVAATVAYVALGGVLYAGRHLRALSRRPR